MKNETVILVCERVGRPPLFFDDVTGNCAECGYQVHHRPHAPKNAILRCIQCAFDLIEPGDEIGTTHEMIADAMRFFRRKMQ